MPLYTFINTETGETRDIFFGMNDEKKYNGGDGESSAPWRRVYTSPNMSMDTKIDPFSAKDFVKKTSGSKKTYGEMIDLSKEMSDMRSSKLGADDPQRAKAEKDFYKPKKKNKRKKQ